MKWKAPSDVSIDFRLELKYPSKTGNAASPHFTAKPAFRRLANHGPAGSQHFDVLDVYDEQWTKCKLSGELYDDRVVKVTGYKRDERWVSHRLRSDKFEGNHVAVVDDLVKCMKRGVDRHMVGRWPESTMRSTSTQLPCLSSAAHAAD